MHQYIGTLPGWLTLLTLVVVGFILLRGGTGTAVSGLQDTNRELVRQIHDLKGELVDARARIRALEAEKDVTIAILPVLDAIRAHETAEAKRTDALLGIMDAIASKLGADGE